jgi:type IV pilus assembly protein PilV
VIRRAGARPSNHQGSTLIEVLVAMVLFSMGVLGLLRTLSFAVRDSGQAEYRIVAMNIADQRLAQIWADLPHYADYAEQGTVLAGLPNGRREVTFDGAVVSVSVAWQAPASAPHSYSSSATLPVTPAAAP